MSGIFLEKKSILEGVLITKYSIFYIKNTQAIWPVKADTYEYVWDMYSNKNLSYDNSVNKIYICKFADSLGNWRFIKFDTPVIFKKHNIIGFIFDKTS